MRRPGADIGPAADLGAGGSDRLAGGIDPEEVVGSSRPVEEVHHIGRGEDLEEEDIGLLAEDKVIRRNLPVEGAGTAGRSPGREAGRRSRTGLDRTLKS